MTFQSHCNHYLQQIEQTRATDEATAELSLHPHLKTLLENVTDECFNRPNVRYTLEPRNINQIGRPDIIATDSVLPIGYIEAETPSTDLNNLTGHTKEQNDRFIQNLDNFILTNFIDFELYKDGQRINTARITDNTDDLKALIQRFLDHAIQIGTPEALAGYLARRTRELKTQIATTLTDETTETFGIYEAFRETLLFTLTKADFADMYAQTLSYGLFAARCTLPNATHFSRLTATESLPQSNRFLKRLFRHVAGMSSEQNVTYILDDIVTLLQNVPTEMLRTAFTPRNHLEDPVIHFYETFLAQYDPQRRIDRGVYYTPPQVISYIVRSVDSLLKTELNRPRGLAGENTLILDPATGTGGFLLSVLNNIRDYVSTTDGTGTWHQYVNEKLVNRIIGFELLVAPYTIAHLKLSLFLQAHGWQSNENLRIYLTNTLEQPAEMVESIPFAAFISDEVNAALSVKRDEPILAIIGNPPYKQHSANPSRIGANLTFIGGLMQDYSQVDGEPLGEANPRALQDDYVKFIRWAQWRIDHNGEGVIGFIVNNNFLDAPTARGMRESLLESFSTIYILNLHGSIRRQENIPENERDENVFDIIQGVCIMLCVKERDNDAPAIVYHADMWGTQQEKYRKLSQTDVQSTEWSELQPDSPYYLFVPHSMDFSIEYETGWKIDEIFRSKSIGIVTARDKLTIHWTAEDIRETVIDFSTLPVEEARERYELPRDTRDWKVHLAQADLRDHPDIDQHLTPIHYRPFDSRWTYYTGRSRGFHCMPRPENMSHLRRQNLAICVCRIVTSANWQHVIMTDGITDNCIISNRGSESAHVSPLYLYPEPDGLLETGIKLNFKPEYLTALAESLELPQTDPHRLPDGITPEQILAYIYAVLYSPTYRDRYYEFLRYDFPRIPLPQNTDHFHTLAALGQELIDLHLLKNVPQPTHRFEGEGDGMVERVRYTDNKVWINTTQHFTDIPQEVWEYEIGAYQVCHKWLKDRKDRRLTTDNLNQYRKILVAIAETIRIMDTIDNILPSLV